jgi:hypothetical protein
MFEHRIRIRIRIRKLKIRIRNYSYLYSTTGYCFRFEVYTGKSENRDKKTNIGQQVVLRLLEEYLGCGRVLFTDNYFTSPLLAIELNSKFTGLVGTIRKPRLRSKFLEKQIEEKGVYHQ